MKSGCPQTSSRLFEDLYMIWKPYSLRFCRDWLNKARSVLASSTHKADKFLAHTKADTKAENGWLVEVEACT